MKNNRAYLYVNALSDFGMNMDTIVLNIVILQMTGSAIWLSAVLLSRVVGGFLSALFAGVLADRYKRKSLMITADLVRFLSLLVLIPFPSPWMIIAVNFMIGVFQIVFQVSFNSELPRIYGEEQVLQTNVFVQRLSSISMVIGFIGAGVIGQYIGFRLALSFDAFSYLLSAVVLSQMSWSSVTQQAVQAVADKSLGVLRKFAVDLREVRNYLLLHPVLLIAYMVCLTEVFGSSAYLVGIPLLAGTIAPAQQPLVYGMIWTAFGIGLTISTLIIPKLKRVKERLFPAYLISAVCMATCCITFMSNTNLKIVFPVAFATGLFDAGIITFYTTIMQKTENHIRGRVFGVSALVNRIGFGIGFILIPLLLQKVTMTHVLWMFQGLLIAVAVLAMVLVARLNAKQAATTAASLPDSSQM